MAAMLSMPSGCSIDPSVLWGRTPGEPANRGESRGETWSHSLSGCLSSGAFLFQRRWVHLGLVWPSMTGR